MAHLPLHEWMMLGLNRRSQWRAGKHCLHCFYGPHAPGRSRERNLRSLQDLCVDTVVANLPMYVEARPEEPFKCLPPVAMTRLLAALMADPFDLHCEPWYVHRLFIGWNTQKINMNMWDYKKKTAENILNLLRKCKNSLLTLRLEFMPDVSSTLHKCLPYLRNLQELKVTDMRLFYINDKTMKVIGTNLSQLRRLSLGFTKVTAQGIKYLCRSNHRIYGKCKKLTYIKMKATDLDEFDATAILYALEHLPNLITFKHRHTFEAVYLFHQKYGSTRALNLNLILICPVDYQHTLRERDTMEMEEEGISAVVDTAPNIQSLDINKYATSEMMSALLEASKISKLELQWPKIDQVFVDKLCKNLGSTISELILSNFDFDGDSVEIDISVIAHYCQNLDRFVFAGPSTSTHKYDMSEEFKRIKNVVVRYDSPNFPFIALKAMLSSELLKSISLRMHNLTEPNLNMIILEALENRKIFSCLTSIYISTDSLTLDTMKHIVCLAPKLEYVDMANTSLPIPAIKKQRELIKLFRRNINRERERDKILKSLKRKVKKLARKSTL